MFLNIIAKEKVAGGRRTIAGWTGDLLEVIVWV